MNKSRRLYGALSFLFLVSAGTTLAAPNGKADLWRLVVVGDSISAGVQNFSLLDTQQPHGYAALIAEQARVPMTLPLVPYPGAPNVLELISFGPPPVIQPAPGTLPRIPRDNPFLQPTNLSIPGITVQQALTLTPNPNASPSDPVAGWANIVLGFPRPFLFPGPALTQIQQAVALHPSTVIVWLGNNDVLIPFLFGGAPTPADTFAAAYQNILQALSQTKASLVVANIPDITGLPYLTPVATLARETGLPLTEITSLLGIGPGDYLRPAGVTIAEQILNGAPGPISNYTCSAEPFSSAPMACVLTAAEASAFQETVNSYNSTIASEARLFGATLVDIYSLVEDIYRNGYKSAGYCMNAGFLGGLFSLDGVHPTNTGYAIIANTFIHQMNTMMATGIPPVSVAEVVKRDPLVFPSVHCGNGH
ncbi:MAG TPA: SGNH/GDSL hydrolase family protein [Bryobacteraceae bacterium]|jgi:lysophospholipase L1-like esterase